MWLAARLTRIDTVDDSVKLDPLSSRKITESGRCHVGQKSWLGWPASQRAIFFGIQALPADGDELQIGGLHARTDGFDAIEIAAGADFALQIRTQIAQAQVRAIRCGQRAAQCAAKCAAGVIASRGGRAQATRRRSGLTQRRKLVVVKGIFGRKAAAVSPGKMTVRGRMTDRAGLARLDGADSLRELQAKLQKFARQSRLGFADGVSARLLQKTLPQGSYFVGATAWLLPAIDEIAQRNQRRHQATSMPTGHRRQKANFFLYFPNHLIDRAC